MVERDQRLCGQVVGGEYRWETYAVVGALTKADLRALLDRMEAMPDEAPVVVHIDVAEGHEVSSLDGYHVEAAEVTWGPYHEGEHGGLGDHLALHVKAGVGSHCVEASV